MIGLTSTEKLVGAPGFDPGRLQQSAAPVYKTEPHASADAVIGRSGRIRTSDLFVPDEEHFQAALHSDEMARCTGLEPVSLDRQSSCLTRCITAQDDRAGKSPKWCAWLDSNEHWTRPRRVPSADWGTGTWRTRQDSNLRWALPAG